MKIACAVFATLLLFGSVTVFMNAKSAIHEILSGVMLISGVIIIATITILDALEEIRDRLPEKKIDDKNG